MQLSEIRQEILNHGFDPTYFSASRLNDYINKGYLHICRRVDYYVDEAVSQFQTTQGTASYPLPADFAKLRAVEDNDRNVDLEVCTLRDIDRSTTASGTPNFYAMDAAKVHFYPTPDGVHNMQIRYWNLPPKLVNDTDVPTLADDYHDMLWLYGCWLCFEAEDDQAQAPAYQQRFQTRLSEFKADQQYPDSDEPMQARGMWDSQPILSPDGAWTLYGGA